MADKAKLLKAAQKHLTKGNLDKAIKVFQQLVDVDSRDHRLVLRLADLQARAGRKKEAITNYEKVAAKYIKDDFTPKAIAVYKTILRLDPELLSAYEKLTELYKNQGLEAEAISQLENLFKIYEKKNDEDKQIEVLKLMSDMDSENLGVQVRLGETLAKKGRKQEAAEAFAKAASTLSKRGMHDRASSLFEKIITLNPGNIAVRKELCAHYLESGQYPEARKEIEAILEIEPDDPRMELLLGRILFQLGYKGDGEKHLARSLDLFHGAGELDRILKEYLFVAQTHLRNDEMDEAEAFYRQINRVAPQEIKALKGLVTTAEKRNDRVGQIDGLLMLGRAQVTRDDIKGAVGTFNRVLELDPLNEEAKAYLAETPTAGETAAPPPEIGLADPAPPSPADAAFQEDTDVGQPEPEVLEVIDDLEEMEEPEVLIEAAPDLEVLEVDGEDAVEIIEIPEEAVEDLDDQIPDIVLEDFDEEDLPAEELPEPAAPAPADLAPVESETATATEPVDSPEVMTLEETLAEADVYGRYNLNDKVAQLLETAAEQYPGDPRVLDRLATHQLQVGDQEAAVTARSLIQAWLDQGDQEKAAEAYSRFSAGLPDPSAIADMGTQLVDRPVSPVDEAPADLPTPDMGPAPEDAGEPAFEEPMEFELAPAQEEETGPGAANGDMVFETVEEEGVSEEVPAALGDPFAEDLEEAEFYLSQGLKEEARRIYSNILSSHPGHQAAVEGMAALDSPGGISQPAEEREAPTGAADPVVADPAPVPVPPETGVVAMGDAREFKSRLIVEDSTPEDTGGFLDLADELREELAGEMETDTGAAAEGPVTFEEVFAEFKKGIEETLGDEEYETHYNLGIAYKDMGLYDDAIREFEVGTHDPDLAQDSLSLMAMCFMEKKDHDSAVKTLQRALEASGGKDRSGLHYQLGEAYEKMGDRSQALASYEKVKTDDPSFEGIDDALERVRKLEDLGPEADEQAPEEGGDMDDMLADLIKEVEEMAQESDSEDEPPPPPKKNRISYL